MWVWVIKGIRVIIVKVVVFCDPWSAPGFFPLRTAPSPLKICDSALLFFAVILFSGSWILRKKKNGQEILRRRQLEMRMFLIWISSCLFISILPLCFRCSPFIRLIDLIVIVRSIRCEICCLCAISSCLVWMFLGFDFELRNFQKSPHFSIGFSMYWLSRSRDFSDLSVRYINFDRLRCV